MTQLVFCRVHPPRPLEPAALEALMVRLASDPTHAPVVFEARSRPAGRTAVGHPSAVHYWLGTTPEHLRWLRRTCHDLLPGLLVEPEPSERLPVSHAARVRARPRSLALAVDRPTSVAAALLSALNQRLSDGEQLVVQIVLGPRRTPTHRRDPVPDPAQAWWSLLLSGNREANADVRKQHERRIGQAGMAACLRLGVSASTRERRRRLLTGLLGGLSTAKAPGTYLRLTPEPIRRLNRASRPLLWEFVPAAAELVGLLAWPLGDADLPGLPPMHPRRMPPSPALIRQHRTYAPERVIGMSTAAGPRVTIGVRPRDALHHLVALGPTGSGKSTALLHLIGADIAAGRPVLVIDPKRQLIDDVVARAVPAERIDDVVLLDPDEQRVVGFNPLDVGSRDPDVVVDGLLAVFAAVFADGWGPRTQDILHSGLLTLARVGATRARRGEPPFTLLDLPRLFTDRAFRHSVVGHVADDPGLGQFWAWYEAQTSPAQAAALAAPLNKLRQYLLRPSLRRILGQPQPPLRVRDLFRDRKVVLVPLNEGLIGPITARLLGGLLLAEAWSATLERAGERQPERRPASIYVDEVHNYLATPTSIEAALAASRSLGVAWHVAHQFRAQLPPGMRAAVDSNARNKLIFRPLDPRDAAAAAQQAPGLEALDFMTLGQFEAYATLVVDGASQPWVSLRTQAPPPETGLADVIRARSRERYGEPTITTTGAPTPADAPPRTPIGRKRKGDSV
ncbi:type IV secretory system conjugative DNA transfer family protein [Nocardioides marmoraquaticus]